MSETASQLIEWVSAIDSMMSLLYNTDLPEIWTLEK
jgi:hypothetical protein